MRSLLRVALVAVLLVACQAPSSMLPLPSLDGTAWILTGLTGRTLAEGAKPTLRFESGRVAGSDGCNRYTGQYTTEKQAFKVVPPIASTQMACAAQTTMEQARAYVEALSVAASYRVEGEQLQLLAASGGVLATFAPQSMGLASTAWRLGGLNNGKGGVASLVPDSAITIEFANDGQASGSSGCNRWNASYKVEGSSIKFGVPALTRKICPVPAVMDQEQQFLQSLAVVATVRVEGDRLELRDAGGALVMTLDREGAD
jgi:heat shock protein HslJ